LHDEFFFFLISLSLYSDVDVSYAEPLAKNLIISSTSSNAIQYFSYFLLCLLPQHCERILGVIMTQASPISRRRQQQQQQSTNKKKTKIPICVYSTSFFMQLFKIRPHFKFCINQKYDTLRLLLLEY
jgi:hypothetical protein